MKLFTGMHLLTAMLAGATLATAQPVRIDPPKVQEFGNFGYAVEPFGADRFLISSLQIDTGTNAGAGEAYLYNVGGARLATFTNPVPTPASFFGNSLSALGADRVVIAASEANKGALTNNGEVYLFHTNGALLATVTNPNLQEFAFFGDAVAGLGNDRIIVGAGGADVGGTFAVGRAYVFRTNGSLLQTINLPAGDLVQDGLFGYALAVVSSNRIAIGAYGVDEGAVIVAGRAYLYTTNGTLITTFTNPAPSTNGAFGSAVAALDAGRVIIGAYGARRSNFPNSGEAYLFRTNGALLATFTNPVPATNANFGGAVAAVGSNYVLIGADGAKVGAVNGAGVAYLFATNGTLVATYTNPAPAFTDQFGWSLAALGTNRLVLGAPQVDAGTNAPNAGRAYLLAPPGPVSTNVLLTLQTNAAGSHLQWVAPDAFVVQAATNLTPPVSWSDTTNALGVSGPTNTVPVDPVTGPAERFFRLRRL